MDVKDGEGVAVQDSSLPDMPKRKVKFDNG